MAPPSINASHPGRHLAVLLGNLRRFVRGQPLVNVVDKGRWF